MEIEINPFAGRKSVWSVSTRDGRTYWTRIGVGFTNKDGSIKLKLDAIPVNGDIHVREWETAEQRAEAFKRRREESAQAQTAIGSA